MASTYTQNTGIEKIGAGEQTGLWNATTNLNFDIIDRASNGVGLITLSGTTHTLTTTDGSLSDGQYKVLVFGGSPSGTNTVTVAPNSQNKQYLVVNNSGQSVIISQGSGASVTVANGATEIVYCDGAGSAAAVIGLASALSGLAKTANNGSDFTNAGTVRANLGLVIGTNVQAYAAVLANTTASFLTAEKSKLTDIEPLADVTDTPNVTAAGALMDSEVNANLKTFSLPASTTISAFGKTLVDDADAPAALVTLGVSSTAAELNILDGVTSTTSELNILDGVTATTAEINILDGVTATTAELNILDGVTATAAEINTLDGITSTVTELNYTDGVTSNIQTQIDANVVPSGTIINVAMNTAPTGYLKANGAAVSRSTYAALFSAIGSTFGVGDGSTTFNVPDLRGEFVRGWDDSRGIDGSRVFGSAQADELKAHLHDVPTRGYSGSASNYGHTVTSTISAGGTQTDISGTEETANTGGTETRPRNIALLACIKV
jgi:microcystin-dependent protein